MLNAETARKRAAELDLPLADLAGESLPVIAHALLTVQAETLEWADKQFDDFTAGYVSEKYHEAIDATRAALKELEAPNGQR